MHAVVIVFAAGWAAFWIYWLVAALSMKRGHVAWLRQLRIRAVILVVVLLLIRAGAFRHGNVDPDPWRAAIGLVLFVVGLGFAIWARVHLGRNWGTPMSRKDEPELVTSGPYRLVRHPIYSGILVAGVGTAVALGPIWLIAVVLAGIYFVYSATVEESYLNEQFPEHVSCVPAVDQDAGALRPLTQARAPGATCRGSRWHALQPPEPGRRPVVDPPTPDRSHTRARRTCDSRLRQFEHGGVMGDLLLADEREAVAAASRHLAQKGLVIGTAGNISARKGDLIAVTPTGADLSTSTAEMVTVIDLDGAVVDGDLAPPPRCHCTPASTPPPTPSPSPMPMPWPPPRSRAASTSCPRCTTAAWDWGVRPGRRPTPPSAPRNWPATCSRPSRGATPP